AYVAWGELPEPEDGAADDYAPYRQSTLERLTAFQARRLEAMEWIASRLEPNKYMEKTPFRLPDLAEFESRARHLAQALDEFLTLERHVELAGWKSARLLPPERRALLGETLLVRYDEADQDEGVAEQNRENRRRKELYEQYRAEYQASHPNAKRVTLPPEQKRECDWKPAGMRFRLRFETEGVDGDLDAILGLCALREGDSVVAYPRLTQDSRLPEDERTDNTPTPKQMLYGARARIVGIEVQKDEAGRVVSGFVEVEMSEPRGGTSARGYTFSAIPQPLRPGEVYTLDPDPNDFMGMWCAKVVEGLCAIEDGREAARHTLYDRLAHPDLSEAVEWPEAARAAQRRFLDGLAAFHEIGLMHELEESKHAYIGGEGDAPILLVQGPPGTGKSYSTAYAILARLQGALAAGKEYRILLSCKTHAATDVLLAAVLGAVNKLKELREHRPDLWDRYFDARTLDVPLMRFRPKGTVPDGILTVPRDEELPTGELRAADRIASHPFCVFAATPGGIYSAITKRWSGRNASLFGHFFCDLLVLDEASQMSLPEAMMAALPLAPAGQLVVVGDPRQMPPIVKHDWENEPRRTFGEYKSYESLFRTLLAGRPPLIQFAESFRLHAAMAEFLREEIYRHDGIDFHSKKSPRLEERAHADPLVAAALSPEHPIVVIVHDEAGSQTLNAFERRLITPVLKALADGESYGLDAEEGLGVVVPHRAQRAALKSALPELVSLDPVTGEVRAQAVDTVERFQGAEREVILVSATESDREYLQNSGEFLLDPCRLTVALSRAKTKMILVASRSVFGYFSSDEALFANSQIWKNLLRRTCTEKLWEGEIEGQNVTVWGNR
ncbi:MAG: ATP-binding protein, partial [Armatimonadetes bacterium]|nr:ATP-binding protein [Armatimonadota bacterium]